MSLESPSSFTIKVFARHTAACPHKTDSNSKKACVCQNHLSIFENGKVTYQDLESSGTSFTF